MKKCEICNKELKLGWIDGKRFCQKRFCSHACRDKGCSILCLKENVRPPSQKGRKWTHEQRERHKVIMSRVPNSMKNPETVKKFLETKKKNFDIRGRKTVGRLLIKRSKVYREWRKAVFERDNYTCIDCKKRGGELEAHHIKTFSGFPELRFELSNGSTLCKECHRKTDTYGRYLRKKSVEMLYFKT